MNCIGRVSLCLFAGALLVQQGVLNGAVLLQSDSRELFGDKPFSYFFVEAEDFHSNNPRGDGESWLLSSDDDALIETVNQDLELDPDAFSSGGESITNALFNSTVTNEEGAGHDVQYRVEFDTPGSYFLYVRHHSPLGEDANRNQNDSFYYPTDFGEDPLQLKANGDDYGLLESMEFPEDTGRRGPWVWFAARDVVENSEQESPIDQDSGTFGQYEVTAGMVGRELIVEFDHRESGTMLDAFVFVDTESGLPPTNGAGPDGIGFFGPGDAVDMEFGLMNLDATSVVGDFDGDQLLTAIDIDLLSAEAKAGTNDLQFDLTTDGLVNDEDRIVWVEDLMNTYFGDADLNGEFNSGDLVAVFRAGKYESGEMASWAEGDWDGNMEFGSGDLVAAFRDGGYELGPRLSRNAVPEPGSGVLLLMGIALLFPRRVTRSSVALY